MSTFDELLSGTVLKTAKRLYKAPTDIQKQVIPILLGKYDLVAMSKTGSGKTAAFLFPMIQLLEEHSKITGCRALILSPTRELCLQTATFFRQYSSGTTLKCASLIGGEPLPPQFDALAQNPDVLVATPGRLLHIVTETSYSLTRVQYLIIDEADKMFELDLEPQLTAIVTLVSGSRQIGMFSATMPELLAEFSRVNLTRAIVIRVGATELPETLNLRFRQVAPPFKPALLVSTIRGYKRCLVFVGTRHHAEFLSALVGDLGVRCACIYGTMDQDERSSSLAAFGRGSVRALFVTDVAARGLDVEGLDLVVNYDFPDRPKLLLHRSGRAGRAGRAGDVVSFVTPDEVAYFAGSRDALKGAEWRLQRVSRAEIEDELTQVDDAVRRSTDLQALQRAMENGEKLFIKSRRPAKPQWLSAAREMPIDAGECLTEERFRVWRPPRTIFEQAAGTRQAELMREIREAHDGHIRSADEPERPREIPVPVEQSFKSKFFIEATKPEEDAATVRDGNVVSLRDSVVEMTPEDQTGLLLQRRAKKWGKTSKKQKVIEAIASGKKAFVRDAVAQLEGVNPKGDKYRAWVEQSHRHIQDAGQEEKLVKGGKRRFGKLKSPMEGRSELKTPEEIERDRLIKMKHKLHDQGKHKEAAQLNQKIFKHKKTVKKGKGNRKK
jgi:ATP-dependent RNA helicase DDX54/DBP10